MDTLQVAILPLVAWWVTFKALFDTGSYLNKLRESVVTGYANGQPISFEHRRAIFFDWRICNVSLLLSAFMYSGINFWIAWYISEAANFKAAAPILALCPQSTRMYR